MRELTKKQVEFQITIIENNIKVLKEVGTDTREHQRILKLYRLKLLALSNIESDSSLIDRTPKDLIS